MEPIRIFYFSDILCIWAYIAQIRLDELQSTFQDQISIQYHFVPVFGNAQEKLEQGWRDRGSSTACHLFLHAIQLLEQKGILQPSERKFEKAIWAFREAFFTKLADVGDRKVQFEIAEGLGLPVTAIQAQIDSGEAYAQLSKDFERVKEHTVTVSPTLIFNEGRQRLNGNVGYRVIEANIRELLHNPSGEQSWC
jgi:predicted DsbA family dithiol-disulfide isomerase